MKLSFVKVGKYLVCCIWAVGVFLFSTSALAQKSDLKVFLDCSNGGNCYTNYTVEKLPFLNYVRDRLDADVHILSKVNYTDAGNEQRLLFFIGRGVFAQHTDTISYSIPSNAQEQERRDAWVQYLLQGLVVYLNKTTLAKHIEVQVKDIAADQAKNYKDPWNFWVMQLGATGAFNGNKNYQTRSAYSYLTANREMNTSKTNLSFDANFERQRYVADSNQTLTFHFKQYGLRLSHVAKLNEHWGAGVWGNSFSSLFSNYVYRIAFGPKVEYSIFPYKEFNTRRLVLVYDINPVFNQYYDTTIYLKKKELLWNHSLSAIGSFTYNWGSINAGVFYNNYLDDWRKNFLGINGGISTRLFKGLNMAVWGLYQLQNNQINLRKGNISTSQLLVRNQELFSAYEYSFNIGFSYRFGSSNNNNVAPMFRGLSYNVNL